MLRMCYLYKMEAALKKSHYTVSEYLVMEEEADFRSEYYEGEIFAMSGGTFIHDNIACNLIHALKGGLKGKGCFVHSSNLKVRIEKVDAFVYPDAMVVCSNRELYKNRKDIIENPKIVFEVLSPSTPAFDRGGKFMRYRTLSSLEEYVLVEQDFPSVEVFRKWEDGKWVLTDYQSMDDCVKLESLGIEISMQDIYEGVSF